MVPLTRIICFPRGEWQLHWLIVNDKRPLPSQRVAVRWLSPLPGRWASNTGRLKRLSERLPTGPSPDPWATPFPPPPPMMRARREKVSPVFAELLSSPKWCLRRVEERRGEGANLFLALSSRLRSKSVTRESATNKQPILIFRGRLHQLGAEEAQRKQSLIYKGLLPLWLTERNPRCLLKTLSSVRNVKSFTST